MESRLALPEAVSALPLDPLREALGDADAYVVGGSVRDLILGAGPGPDIDVAIDGDLEGVIERLEARREVAVEARHRRFGTATVRLGDVGVDLTRTRRETYDHPGALPEVAPAAIDEDLRRRDFTINAMAVPLRDPGELLDPFGGRSDLDRRLLRVLHERSFADDPTRAIRAARYASRIGLEPEPATLELLAMTDLGAVSADRRDAEIARLAGEPAAARGFALLGEWGLIAIDPGTIGLIEAIIARAGQDPWSSDLEARAAAILLAVAGGAGRERAERLAHAQPERPSESLRLAAGHSAAELLLAAAAGSSWVDDYAREWSRVRLEIGGEDLIAAGIPEGPAVGTGLRGALERKLDGGLTGGREEELELALELARSSI
jgi:tRNA nucleotidyltransferase (CCA-adding enzyme)